MCYLFVVVCDVNGLLGLWFGGVGKVGVIGVVGMEMWSVRKIVSFGRGWWQWDQIMLW